MRIALEAQAYRTLTSLRDIKMLNRLEAAIDDIENRGLSASNLKQLSHLKNGYRKRVGRYRILFTINHDEQVIHIWIIEIKKSPKDYRKWIENIEKSR